jgi:hypothetical protein
VDNHKFHSFVKKKRRCVLIEVFSRRRFVEETFCMWKNAKNGKTVQNGAKINATFGCVFVIA